MLFLFSSQIWSQECIEGKCFNGQGTYTWASGTTLAGATGEQYVGEWKDGKRHGQGTFTFADGEVYEGEWKDGKRTGQGTYTFTDGTTQTGIWEDNEYLGQ